MEISHSNNKTKNNVNLKNLFRKKESLNTNLIPSKPFLKSSLLNWFKECLVSPNHYFHVTTFKNIPSIMEKGLDPSYGSLNGSGARVNSQNFLYTSRDLIHAAKYTSTTFTYINLYEKSSEGLKWDCKFDKPSTLKDSPVVLRFPKNIEGINWNEDYFEVEGVTTNSKIKPFYIEALTTEGWVPISSLTEIKKAL